MCLLERSLSVDGWDSSRWSPWLFSKEVGIVVCKHNGRGFQIVILDGLYDTVTFNADFSIRNRAEKFYVNWVV